MWSKILRDQSQLSTRPIAPMIPQGGRRLRGINWHEVVALSLSISARTRGQTPGHVPAPNAVQHWNASTTGRVSFGHGPGPDPLTWPEGATTAAAVPVLDETAFAAVVAEKPQE